MLIYVGEPYNKLITAVEGTGDNLLQEDIDDGYVDYFMTNLYGREDYEINEEEGGQLLTSKPISEMNEEEIIDRLFDYWEVKDCKKYLILERN